MARKIFDISPPQKLRKQETLEEKKPQFKVFLPSFQFKKNLILISFILIIAGTVAYLSLAKVEIEIWPVIEVKTFKTKIIAQINQEEIDFKNKIIPAKIFEAEKVVSQEFPALGKKLVKKKAEGIIRVYNNYSTSPQVLVATTRFISAEGKLFRSLERVVIPGGKYEGEKFIPGYLDIKVQADQPGAEYNIGPSTFSLPGFAGTPLYTMFYGKSFDSMKGGEVKEVSVVTKEDLERAKEALTEKAKEEVELVLEEKIPPQFDLLKEALKTEVLEVNPFAQEGQELEKFNFQVKVKSKALVFRPEDLKNFSLSFLAEQILPEKKVLSESLKMSYLPENINLEEGKISLSLAGEAKIFADIEETSLKKGLAGKSLNEAKFFLENQREIAKANVKIWSFWLKRVPEDLRKIEIKLNLD